MFFWWYLLAGIQNRLLKALSEEKNDQVYLHSEGDSRVCISDDTFVHPFSFRGKILDEEVGRH